MKKFGSFTFVLFISAMICVNSIAQDSPRRFVYPLDVEAELMGTINPPVSFSDHNPGYANILFDNVNLSRDSFPQNEPSVKISRKDPNRMVAAWRDFRRGVSNPTNRQIGYTYSTNGGATWSVSALLDSTLLPGFPRNSDPVVAVDSKGNFYIAVVCIGSSVGVGVYKSTDGGVTFPQAYLTANTGSEDKEWLDTDRTPGSPYFDNLYMSWTRFSGNTGIKLSTSSNGGVNWTDAVSVSDQTSGVQGSDVAVGLDGELYVTWLDVNTADDVIKFDKSTNGGLSFGVDRNIAGGPTPSIPISSSNITFPSIATDLNNGSIYVAWCDARNGDPDIFISKSTNRGDDWSAPLRVNRDPVGNGKLQCWPWIEVDEVGNIAILYYNSVNTTSNNIIEAYVAWSNDHGESFSEFLLSSQPSPTNQPNTAVRFGDYICLDYFSDRVIPVWTDERAGGVNMEIYTARFSTPLGVNQISGAVPAGYELQQNFPNPFNPSTKIRFSVPEFSKVELRVFDALGKEIRTIVSGEFQRGSYEAEFNADGLSAGVYFVRIVAGDFTESRSMLLVK